LLEEMARGVLPLADAVRSVGIAEHLERFVQADQLVDESLGGGVVAVVVSWERAESGRDGKKERTCSVN
jgi:hypothetical protein